jgi:hypothetical protein
MPERQPSPPLPAGSAGPAGRSAYLWEVLRTLWPEPARIRRCGRTAPGFAGQIELLVVPSESRAVLLLPRRPRRAAAGVLRNYKASAATPGRLRFRVLGLAARAGLAEVLPHRIIIEPGPQATRDDIAGYLRAVLHWDAVVGVRISPPRANRKPVLHVVGPDGAELGFVKVGINSLTGELVRAESAALRFLATAPLARLEAPRLIHHGRWRGHEVLVQEAVSGSGPARTWAEVSGAMAELAGIRGITRLPASRSGYWRGLRSRLEACAENDPARALLRALSRLEPVADGTSIAFGTWHGDWTPWNMTMSRRRAIVWDWERFQTGIPVGYDAIHYRLQAAVIRDGLAAQAAAESAVTGAAAALIPLGVEPHNARLVATLYLVEIAARYLHDGQAEAGARLGDVGGWLLPVVVRQAEELTAGGRLRGGAT